MFYRTHHPSLITLLSLFAAAFLPFRAEAAPIELTLRHEHHIFTIRPDRYPGWKTTHEEWTFEGSPIRIPQELRADGDAVMSFPPGISRRAVAGWNTDAIEATLRATVADALDRAPGRVTIGRDVEGKITFDGIGLPGRKMDLPAAAALVAAALEANVPDVVLPVITEQPSITVNDPDLAKLGIQEVVTVGESDYTGSPVNRRHNIAVGLGRFNGYVIPQGSVFSFNEVLGPVGAAEGYRRELVILGERTLPDYGGGLCQVSTTAYRGAWEYGLPIEDRRNHSFAVRYYGPQGTDATIYPPNTDMKFRNDTTGALLIQTHTEGNKAYFVYYGTKDDRQTEVIGPYTWGHIAPPPDKSEYTADIPAGSTREVGHRVPGMRAAWFRVLEPPSARASTGTTVATESYYSIYEARPLFTQIGVEAGSPLLQSASSSVSSEPLNFFPPL